MDYRYLKDLPLDKQKAVLRLELEHLKNINYDITLNNKLKEIVVEYPELKDVCKSIIKGKDSDLTEIRSKIGETKTKEIKSLLKKINRII